MPMLKSKLKAGVLISMAFFSMGFTDLFIKDNPEDNARKFISNVKSSTKPSTQLDVQPVVDLDLAFPIRYKGGEKSPFTVKSFVGRSDTTTGAALMDVCQDAQCGDGAPEYHLPFFLEKYSLDTLEMVGTLNNPNGSKSALIKTPDSGVVTAYIGQYIGKNNGLIIAIDRENLIVREKYRVPNGWEDRMAKLILLRK